MVTLILLSGPLNRFQYLRRYPSAAFGMALFEFFMKVAFVVQRFGEEVIGGAESLAKQIAERLVSEFHWEVDVYTTCATDYFSWQNVFPSGHTKVRGVSIFRFPVTFRRNVTIFRTFNAIARLISILIPKRFFFKDFFEKIWIILQGPNAPSLIKTLSEKSNEYSGLFFFTYLYYPTILGLPRFKKRSILIPTAHDEFPFHFNATKRLFEASSFIFTNAAAEEALIKRVYPQVTSKIRRVGVGVDIDSIDKMSATNLPLSFAEKLPQNESTTRYVLYLGRISSGKGCDNLIRKFKAYFKKTGDDKTILVLTGKIDAGDRRIFFNHRCSQIVIQEPVSEQEKFAIIANASCLINPSPFESLSLIVLEALALKVPVLVSAQSDVLKNYEKETQTVFSFSTTLDFIEKLQMILSVPWKQPMHQARLENSKDWVAKNFDWNLVLKHYRNSLEDLS